MSICGDPDQLRKSYSAVIPVSKVLRGHRRLVKQQHPRHSGRVLEATVRRPSSSGSSSAMHIVMDLGR